jgi:Flp pilus assembly protein TadD
MSRYRPAAPPPDETHEDALVRRAFRFRRKGEERRAMVALREAALGAEHSARLWTLYGVQCTRLGRLDAAAQALTHAVWLRVRAGETGKARVTRALLDRATQGRAA